MDNIFLSYLFSKCVNGTNTIYWSTKETLKDDFNFREGFL